MRIDNICKELVRNFVASKNTKLEKEFIKKLNRYKVKWQPKNKKVVISPILEDYSPCLHLAYLCKTIAQKENANVGLVSVKTKLEDPNYSENIFRKLLYSEISYKKLDKIYLSYGGKVVFRNVFQHKHQNIIYTKFNQIMNSIASKDDVVNIQVDGIKIGDLIYDYYLRFYIRPTVNIKDPVLGEIIKQALNIFFNLKNLIKKYEIKALISVYTTYIHHGIFARLCLANNIPVYTTGSHNSIVNKAHDFFPSHFNAHFLYKKIFDSLDLKEERLNEAQQLFERRFNGVKDDAISYMRVNAFSKEYNVALSQYDWSNTVVVLAHCMFDSPHVYRQLLFPDFYEWLVFTLDTLSLNRNITVLVKQHPNGLDGNDEIFQGLKKKYKETNIVFISKNTSNQQILDLKPMAVVTAHGTAGAEFTYFDIPVVNVFDNPYAAFNFTHTGHSLKEYGELLSKVRTLENVNNRFDILAHYYMHHIFFLQNIYKDYLNLIDYKSDTYSDTFLTSYLPRMDEMFFAEIESIKSKGLEFCDWIESKIAS